MAENNKKFNVVSIVILAVLAVALIMGIVGLCIDWWGMSAEGESEAAKLSQLISENKDFKDFSGKAMYAGVEAAQAFGIIAIIAAALTAVSYVVSKFVDVKVLKWVTLGCAVLLIVSALVALICTFCFGTSDYLKAIKDAADAAGSKLTYMPAAGCWLLSIFGIVGGAAGVYGAIKG